MSGDLGYTGKFVSPVKCNEKPWDLWISEIGHASPRPDDDLVFMPPAEAKGGGSRGGKPRPGHYRRSGLNRLRYESMDLHGLFPQMDNLNAAVCHMCGVTVKCSAAYRHLLESHSGTEPILPPPPPAPTVKLKSSHSRSKHKKEPVHTPPLIDPMPMKMETSPIHTASAPLSRLAVPQPDLQYLDEASTSGSVSGEVQVCVESGELPVVSIQDTDDLHLGENITDDIFAIMNSEGIQSADDITSSADWKNIIRDIGNMQDINFSQPSDPTQPQDLYSSVDTTSLQAYALSDTDLSSLQFANSAPVLPTVIDTPPTHQPQALKPATVTTPSTKSQSRSKSSKTKFNLREYDPNKHCGVVTSENMKPCTRSLTCKAHALSLRRMVEGRAKPFDTLLAEHRAARDANVNAAAAAAAAAVVVPPPPAPLVPAGLDLAAFNGLTPEQQVNNIYATLLNVEDPAAMLPDAASLSSLLSQPLPDSFLLPDDAEPASDVPLLSIGSPLPTVKVEDDRKTDEVPPPLVPTEVCWYTSSPRPLALCGFNASHAGGVITLGKKFATVRSNIKSSLSRTNKAQASSSSAYYFGPSTLSLSKSVHMNNASKCGSGGGSVGGAAGGAGGGAGASRRLVVRCGATGGGARLNGHVPRRATPRAAKRPAAAAPRLLDLGYALDPLALLADDKC